MLPLELFKLGLNLSVFLPAMLRLNSSTPTTWLVLCSVFVLCLGHRCPLVPETVETFGCVQLEQDTCIFLRKYIIFSSLIRGRWGIYTVFAVHYYVNSIDFDFDFYIRNYIQFIWMNVTGSGLSLAPTEPNDIASLASLLSSAVCGSNPCSSHSPRRSHQGGEVVFGQLISSSTFSRFVFEFHFSFLLFSDWSSDS